MAAAKTESKPRRTKKQKEMAAKRAPKPLTSTGDRKVAKIEKQYPGEKWAPRYARKVLKFQSGLRATPPLVPPELDPLIVAAINAELGYEKAAPKKAETKKASSTKASSKKASSTKPRSTKASSTKPRSTSKKASAKKAVAAIFGPLDESQAEKTDAEIIGEVSQAAATFVEPQAEEQTSDAEATEANSPA